MPEHAFDAQMNVGGVWLDVTGDVRQTSPVVIVKGGGEVSQAPRPSSLSLTLNDQAGKYRPDRAMSPLYGKVGRNTPIAVPGGIFEISGWAPDRTVDHDTALGRGDQTTDIDAGGILRRVGTWTDNIESAISQAVTDELTSAPILGYWRLEDEAGARYPAPQTGKLADPRASFNAEFGQTDAPFGANSSVSLSPSSAVAGRFLPGSSSAGWKLAFGFKLRQVPTAATFNRLMLIQVVGGYRFDIFVNNTSFRVQTLDPAVGTATTDVPFTSSLGPTVWTWMDMEVSVATSTTSNWEINWYGQNDSVTWSQSGTAAFPAGVLDFWQVGGNDYTDGALFSHVVGVQGTAPNLYSFNLVSAFNGWVGETAGDRFARLMDLSGLSWVIKGSAADTAPMGPQGANTLLEHLREIRDTEDGMLYDSPGALAVTLRTRTNLYNQTPALALTYGLNVAPPLRPVVDDLGTANVVTVANRLGGIYVARDDTSSMGTQPPPDGAGEAKQRIDVSMSLDADLQPRAEWALAIGTNPEARYASVVVDLDAAPTLEDAASAVEPGDRITVRGADPDLIDLLVISITDKYDTKFRRTVTFACRPYRTYAVGVLDDVARYDADDSVTDGAKSATATSWPIRSSTPDGAWSTTDLPYEWMVAGERIKVVTMSAPAGTYATTQTAGVVRSLNGVIKSHLDGEEIHVATPGRWAL